MLAAAPAFAQGDSAAAELLQRMSTAVRSLDYQGSFIYEHDGRIDALRIFHAGEGRGRERLISMSGPRSELVRDGSSITCVQSGAPTILFQNGRGARLLPLVPNTGGRSFDQYYALRSEGEDRVAGYGARVVDIVPRDAWRYGYRLWIEERSDMLLRSAVVDAARHTLEQFMFVALEVGAQPKRSDLVPSSEAGLGAPPAEVPLAGAPQWRVADLPPGFRFTRALRTAQGAPGVEHQMYSDGLANVSVYVEPRTGTAPPAADRAVSRGVISLYSHETPELKITVLGDAPGATIERMARSVRPISAEAGLK